MKKKQVISIDKDVDIIIDPNYVSFEEYIKCISWITTNAGKPKIIIDQKNNKEITYE